MKKTYSFISCFAMVYVLVIIPGISNSFDRETLKPISVEFKYNSIDFSIMGEKIAPHTYLFNKDGGKKISITTLDWMPYIGESICKQGWVQQLTIALLTSQGYEITSRFLPWARTIALAESGGADILYPEYFIESTAPSDVYKGTKRIDHLALSKKIPGGPIVFVKRKNEPDNYHGDLNHLKDEKIGVVRGYQNTPEFDALMDSGFFNISKAVDDLMNVNKLYNHRINLIIGDAAAIKFSIMSSSHSKIDKDKILQGIEVVQPMIQYNYLYYAISKKRHNWKRTLDDLNHAITSFEKSGLMFDIIRRANRDCGYKLEEIFLPYRSKSYF